MDELLFQLDKDPEKAGLLYIQIHKKLTRFFINKGNSNPEELSDITLNRVAKHVKEERPIATLDGWIMGVARFVSLEAFKKQVRIESIDSKNATGDNKHELIASGITPEVTMITESQRKIINTCTERCFGKLSEDDRDFFSRYLSKGGWGTAERKRASRIRALLKGCVNQCVNGR